MLARSLGALFLVCVAAQAAQGGDHAKRPKATPKAAPAASALRFRPTLMRTQGVALPPMGYVEFCQREPRECISRNRRSRPVALTTARMQRLIRVNTHVNASVRPISDMDHYGVVEHWTYPRDHKGDCEDYVLEKRRLLMRRGWPESALLITVVNDEHNEGHAVLTVHTTHGDLILDNKNSKILPWYKTAYTYLKRQSTYDPRAWESVAPQGGSAGAIAAGPR
jgi:predicted transglutaminase-like cysteine proteinase